MQELDKTTRITNVNMDAVNTSNLLVTVFDGISDPRTICLNDFHKDSISFGRNETNDIVLSSPLVSREHGRFIFWNGQWRIEDKALYADRPSENGLIYNNMSILSRELCDGDFIRIDDGVETISEGVLLIFASKGSANKWDTIGTENKSEITIGRDKGCDIVLPHISISKVHARILREQGKYYIIDNNSTNGVAVNNRRITGKVLLHEKDVIVITNSKLIFTSSAISFCCYRNGISVDTANVVIKRGKGRKSFVTGNDISLNIRPGELVAIIGGSGAGKSTILNCMCGYLPPSSGDVYINGINLYQNFDTLKKLIGYVPQSDIVYDELTLYDMLSYTAKLRLPKDVSEAEREAAIDRAVSLVELAEKKKSYIKALSGGQKKRASIAVELLSDPNLIFLDEPSSGLDPGTERSLMQSLREMANGGKTVILVTHSTLQLKLCDKIIFMGKGGNLCYFGSYDNALQFFGVSDIVDVYNMITENAGEWRNRYDKTIIKTGPARSSAENITTAKSKNRFQLPVLCSRYLKLIINDRQRILLLLLQAPILALLIALVADGKQFEQYEVTQSLLFALSCSAFWVGMLNAIQEVCKERNIVKREYMTGLSLNSYLISKILVLGVLSLIQSTIIVGIFYATVVQHLDKGIITGVFTELLITTFLTAIASAAMGLFVSSLFTNADRAMTLAPVMLMPQILFSGICFPLEGVTEKISWFAVCRWSMEGYGTTSNLNELSLKIQQEIPQISEYIQHLPDDMFKYDAGHMKMVWGILVLFVIVFLILARIVLSNIGKERS